MVGGTTSIQRNALFSGYPAFINRISKRAIIADYVMTRFTAFRGHAHVLQCASSERGGRVRSASVHFVVGERAPLSSSSISASS
ncbi:hypothetical protein KCP78_06075 [Salmonella enterica subsp. enterica]|nr:hypothetical protein KCP78_06075 [Salmonella enterica subsp. enterica]